MRKFYGVAWSLFFFYCFTIIAPSDLNAQKKDREMEKLIRKNMEFARAQYKLLAKNTPADRMPRNFSEKEQKLETAATSWWTSGFFPGSLWYIYEFTGDTAIRAEAERRLTILEKEKYHTKDHDLGFMIYNSFGNAYRITQKESYKETILTAAETLMQRYRPSIRSLQSWDSSDRFKCPVIVDNMMNLELLCWSADELREPKYKVVAIAHSNTTMKQHYRPDYSAYHVVDYDLAKGTVREKMTAQGAAPESAWARGQSWGLYGFTMMYRFTEEPSYLQHARNVAQFLLKHPRLPADKIPYWDFDAKEIPDTYRDVSAAAIMASALLELGKYVEGDERNEYVNTARRILINLSGKKYRCKPGSNAGFLLRHSVGALPYQSEVDVSISYADYYFLEALMRFREWYL
jgi:hypothetical protein